MLAGDGARRVVRREAVARAGGAQGLQDFFVRVDHWALLGGGDIVAGFAGPSAGAANGIGPARAGMAQAAPPRLTGGPSASGTIGEPARTIRRADRAPNASRARPRPSPAAMAAGNG